MTDLVKCEYCDETFNTYHKFMIHLRKHHPWRRKPKDIKQKFDSMR